MKTFNPVKSPFSDNHKLDDIDKAIVNRALDKHPKYMAQLYNELGLTPFVAAISTHSVIRPITPLWRSRSMNFYEAASAGSFTREETRVGMIVAAIISCCRLDEPIYRSTKTPPANLSSFIPVYLTGRTNYASLLGDTVKPQEVDKVNACVKMFLSADPNRSKLKNDAICVYLRDACLAWVTSGDAEVIDFMINRGGARTKAILDMGFSEIPESYRSDVTVLYETALNNYNNTFYTKWGVSRSFQRNHAQSIKRIFS